METKVQKTHKKFSLYSFSDFSGRKRNTKTPPIISRFVGFEVWLVLIHPPPLTQQHKPPQIFKTNIKNTKIKIQFLFLLKSGHILLLVNRIKDSERCRLLFFVNSLLSNPRVLLSPPSSSSSLSPSLSLTLLISPKDTPFHQFSIWFVCFEVWGCVVLTSIGGFQWWCCSFLCDLDLGGGLIRVEFGAFELNLCLV